MVATIKNGLIVTWQHINLQGEYDFSDRTLENSFEFKLPERSRRGSCIKMNFMKREQTWYPIEKIALFESTVADGIAATEENYATFLEAKNKPHVLDDSIIDRAIRLYRRTVEDVGYIDQQNTRWRKGTLTASQQDRVDARLLIRANISANSQRKHYFL